MALMRTVIKSNLANGIRCYDPIFKPTIKQHKPTLWNFTTDKIYRELLQTFDKPPRMHSFFIPKWKEIRQWQAEAALDLGLPAYKRWPFGATMYRALWTLTIVNLIYVDYKLYICIMNQNYGLTKGTALSMTSPFKPSYFQVLSRKIERVKLALLLERKDVERPELRRRKLIIYVTGGLTIIAPYVYELSRKISKSTS